MSVPAAVSNRLGGDAFAGVAEVLWDEREILQRLLALLVPRHRARHARGRARVVVDELRTCEVLRAAEVQALAAAFALPPRMTLADLAVLAPQPWQLMFAEHRDALRGLVAALDAVQGGAATSQVAAPHTAASHTAAPHTAASHTAAPHTAGSHTAAPHMPPRFRQNSLVEFLV